MRPDLRFCLSVAAAMLTLSCAAVAAAGTATVNGSVDLGKGKAACADVLVIATRGDDVVAKANAVADPKRAGYCTYALAVPADAEFVVRAVTSSDAQFQCNGHPKTKPKAKMQCDERPAKLLCNGMVKSVPVTKATLHLKSGDVRTVILQLKQQP